MVIELRWRKNETYKNLPIIAVTAKKWRAEKNHIIQAGASDYILLNQLIVTNYCHYFIVSLYGNYKYLYFFND
jgi:DNA-binding NarL/FixJ family response regulator